MRLPLFIPLVLIALAFLLLPFAGSERLFSMHVDSGWLASRHARKTRHMYQSAVALVTVICIGLETLFQVNRQLTSFILIVEVAALLASWSWGWSRTLPFRSPQPVVRTATLRPQAAVQASHRWSLAALLPILATALVLFSQYQIIPTSFAIHFNAHRVPNHVVLRSWITVFGPLMIGATVVLLLAEMLQTIQEHGAGLAEKEYFVLTGRIVVGVTWMMALECAASALLPILHPADTYAVYLEFFSEAASLVFLLFTIGLLVKNRSVFISGQNATNEIHWKGGLLYFNRDDAALFAPKRLGFGWTLNMAQPAAWLVISLVVTVACVQFALRHL